MGLGTGPRCRSQPSFLQLPEPHDLPPVHCPGIAVSGDESRRDRRLRSRLPRALYRRSGSVPRRRQVDFRAVRRRDGVGDVPRGPKLRQARGGRCRRGLARRQHVRHLALPSHRSRRAAHVFRRARALASPAPRGAADAQGVRRRRSDGRSRRVDEVYRRDARDSARRRRRHRAQDGGRETPHVARSALHFGRCGRFSSDVAVRRTRCQHVHDALRDGKRAHASRSLRIGRHIERGLLREGPRAESDGMAGGLRGSGGSRLLFRRAAAKFGAHSGRFRRSVSLRRLHLVDARGSLPPGRAPGARAFRDGGRRTRARRTADAPLRETRSRDRVRGPHVGVRRPCRGELPGLFAQHPERLADDRDAVDRGQHPGGIVPRRRTVRRRCVRSAEDIASGSRCAEKGPRAEEEVAELRGAADTDVPGRAGTLAGVLRSLALRKRRLHRDDGRGAVPVCGRARPFREADRVLRQPRDRVREDRRILAGWRRRVAHNRLQKSSPRCPVQQETRGRRAAAAPPHGHTAHGFRRAFLLQHRTQLRGVSLPGERDRSL